MFAQLLPGFREVRAPLTAGFLWMVLGWLILRDDIASAHGPTEQLVVLGREVTTPVLVGVASFAAYLVGSLSQDIFSEGLEKLLVRLVWPKVWRNLGPPGQMSDAYRESEIERLRSETGRLEAECDLRIAILPPLVALVVYFAFNDSFVWLSGLLIVPVFVLQLWGRAGELGITSLTLEKILQGAGMPPDEPSRLRTNLIEGTLNDAE